MRPSRRGDFDATHTGISSGAPTRMTLWPTVGNARCVEMILNPARSPLVRTGSGSDGARVAVVLPR